LISRRAQGLLRHGLHVGGQIVVGQRRRPGGEGGVGLQGQVIGGKVRRPQPDGGFQVAAGLFQRLPRQGIHEIQIHLLEEIQGRFRSGQGLPVVVDATQGPEVNRVETLDPQGQAVHAGLPEPPETGHLEGARVRLQGDFRQRRHSQQGAQAHQQAVDGFRREQAGGTASDEDAGDLAAPDLGHGLFQIPEQRVQVAGFRDVVARGVGIEVAVGALAHAPGDMDVQTQGGRRFQAAIHDHRDAGLPPIIRRVIHREAPSWAKTEPGWTSPRFCFPPFMT
jgi:hypothetical protein